MMLQSLMKVSFVLSESAVFMSTTRRLCFALTILLSLASGAAAQQPPPAVTVPTPQPNPSSSLVLPAPRQVPVYPGPTGTAPGAVGAVGGNLAGTNQVVNPPRSVLHAARRRHHHYLR
jgi:hypothetical protein